MKKKEILVNKKINFSQKTHNFRKNNENFKILKNYKKYISRVSLTSTDSIGNLGDNSKDLYLWACQEINCVPGFFVVFAKHKRILPG